MKIRSKVTIGLLSSVMCMAAVAAAANGYKKASGPKDGITFKTKAIGGAMTIEGKAGRLEYAEQVGGDLLFKANLFLVKTGMDGRDEHLRDVLKVQVYKDDKAKTEKFKYAKLKVPVSSVSVGKGKTGNGKFTINGQEAPLKFTYDAEKKGGKVEVHAWFPLKLTEHGVDKICKLGVCVEDLINVDVNFALTPP